jgi:hypothetical protein
MWSVQWIQPFEVGEFTWPWPDEPPGSLVFNIEPGDEPVAPGELS